MCIELLPRVVPWNLENTALLWSKKKTIDTYKERNTYKERSRSFSCKTRPTEKEIVLLHNKRERSFVSRSTYRIWYNTFSYYTTMYLRIINCSITFTFSNFSTDLNCSPRTLSGSGAFLGSRPFFVLLQAQHWFSLTRKLSLRAFLRRERDNCYCF